MIGSMSQIHMGKLFFRFMGMIAQFQLARPIIIWGIAHMSKFMPNQAISETDSLVCFYHPQPSYPIHILLVPKEDIRDLKHFDPGESDFLLDLFSTVRILVDELNLQRQGYRLVLNGGEYQEFPQLHFHLISGE